MPVPAFYTATQRVQLRAAFADTAARYRRRMKWVKWILIGALGPLFISSFAEMLGIPFPDLFLLAGLLPFLGPVFIVFVLLTQALLKCPGCTQKLETVGTYCPECGHAGLVPAVSRWFSSTPAHCTACGKDLVIRKGKNGGRQYVIRACSSCGLYLDDEGL